MLEAIFAKYGYDFRDYATDSMPSCADRACEIRNLPSRRATASIACRARSLRVDARRLTVQVSEMFRDPTFFGRSASRSCLPLRTYPQMKIWHAGCATGEEAYGTAILLMEEDLYERAQIYATDMSARALEQAREGVYSESQSACFASNYREAGGKRPFEDYCSAAYGRVAVREIVRKNVVFFQHDLVLGLCARRDAT